MSSDLLFKHNRSDSKAKYVECSTSSAERNADDANLEDIDEEQERRRRRSRREWQKKLNSKIRGHSRKQSYNAVGELQIDGEIKKEEEWVIHEEDAEEEEWKRERESLALLLIFSFFDVPTLLRCALVCRRWRQLASLDCLWKGKIDRYFLSNYYALLQEKIDDASEDSHEEEEEEGEIESAMPNEEAVAVRDVYISMQRRRYCMKKGVSNRFRLPVESLAFLPFDKEKGEEEEKLSKNNGGFWFNSKRKKKLKRHKHNKQYLLNKPVAEKDVEDNRVQDDEIETGVITEHEFLEQETKFDNAHDDRRSTQAPPVLEFEMIGSCLVCLTSDWKRGKQASLWRKNNDNGWHCIKILENDNDGLLCVGTLNPPLLPKAEELLGSNPSNFQKVAALGYTEGKVKLYSLPSGDILGTITPLQDLGFPVSNVEELIVCWPYVVALLRHSPLVDTLYLWKIGKGKIQGAVLYSGAVSLMRKRGTSLHPVQFHMFEDGIGVCFCAQGDLHFWNVSRVIESSAATKIDKIENKSPPPSSPTSVVPWQISMLSSLSESELITLPSSENGVDKISNTTNGKSFIANPNSSTYLGASQSDSSITAVQPGMKSKALKIIPDATIRISNGRLPTITCIRSCGISNYRYIACGLSDGKIMVADGSFKIAQITKKFQWQGDQSTVVGIDGDIEGKLLLTTHNDVGCPRCVISWDGETGERKYVWKGSCGPIIALASAPCGKVVCSSLEDGIISLSNHTGLEIHRYSINSVNTFVSLRIHEYGGGLTLAALDERGQLFLFNFEEQQKSEPDLRSNANNMLRLEDIPSKSPAKRKMEAFTAWILKPKVVLGLFALILLSVSFLVFLIVLLVISLK